MDGRTTTSPESQSFPQLGRPPIVEAALEVKFTEPTTASREEFQDVLRRLEPDYTITSDIESFAATLNLGDNREPLNWETENSWSGCIARNEKMNQVAQFNVSLLAYSKLPVYAGWERFLDESLRLLCIYRELNRSEQVQRLGIRYINKVSLDQIGLSLRETLRTPPTSPFGAEATASRFLNQMHFEIPGTAHHVQVIHAFPAANEYPGQSLIVDIDVSTLAPFPYSEEEIIHQLTLMHNIKNRAFFGSISEPAKEALI